MTQEEINKVIELDRMLKTAKRLKRTINTGTNRLYYATMGDDCRFRAISDELMKVIPYEVIETCDKMIRAEIDAKIEKLKKEIEEL